MSPGEGEVLFEVLYRDGRRFAVYTNGAIEGFPEGAMIHNCYPRLVSDALLAQRKELTLPTQTR